MSNDKDGPLPNIEVPDATAAFRKLEDFTRKVMGITKKRLDAETQRKQPKKKRHTTH